VRELFETWLENGVIHAASADVASSKPLPAYPSPALSNAFLVASRKRRRSSSSNSSDGVPVVAPYNCDCAKAGNAAAARQTTRIERRMASQ
jgi:hypothetical protein